MPDATEPRPSPPASFTPYVSDRETLAELTLLPVVIGALLGILFGASSIYLVLKVGLTISASIPVAVLAITVFKLLGKTTILQNNIVQTTGCAGESIAFGVGLVMPALLLLGFNIDVIRVMTVGVLGGLLGILLMIPLRRAFIVKQHGELKYPEGTATADVLIAGERGGSMAKLLFGGFGLGFVFMFAVQGLKLLTEVVARPLYSVGAAGKTVGLKAGVLSCEMSAPLLGVGYIIGPRIAGIMVAGGVLAYLVLVPAIAYFGDSLTTPVLPAQSDVKEGVDRGLIRNMSPNQIRSNYILYVGAGAVAAGGLISMFKALPTILGAIIAGLRDVRGPGPANPSTSEDSETFQPPETPRTERDLPMSVVLLGSFGMLGALMLIPAMGLGVSLAGLFGAVCILLFGFLFVTVSSRLTGEIGSSSNPISGMTVATLLVTCLLIVTLSELGVVTLGKETKLLALTIAGVVCIACSNGGTTSQALKTGHLLGATPRAQQYAILVGSLTSALVVGLVLIVMNTVWTIYSKQNLPNYTIADVSVLSEEDRVQVGMYASDTKTYKVLHLGEGEPAKSDWFTEGRAGQTVTIKPGRYLIDPDTGRFVYLVDPAINGKLSTQDNGEKVQRFDAPKTQLIALIINGIFDRNLPWDLVLIGVLIALTLELAGVPSLPFAVGVYVPLAASTPIFLGGLVRWVVDTIRRPSAAEGDSSPGVLLSSGYIAGGSIAALLAAMTGFSESFAKSINLAPRLETIELFETPLPESPIPVGLAFLGLALVLLIVGLRKRS